MAHRQTAWDPQTVVTRQVRAPRCAGRCRSVSGGVELWRIVLVGDSLEPTACAGHDLGDAALRHAEHPTDLHVGDVVDGAEKNNLSLGCWERADRGHDRCDLV